MFYLGFSQTVCFLIVVMFDLMRADETFLALRLRSGLILTLLVVSRGIKTEAGTALYLTNYVVTPNVIALVSPGS